MIYLIYPNPFVLRPLLSLSKGAEHSEAYRRIFILFLLTVACSANASILSEWKYSQASNASQKGDYAHAQEVMRSMLIDEPDRPDLLYDLGTASFKNKEYEQAAAYFQGATQSEECSPQLQEQALFNLGNTCVELKELNDAIVHYERALALNPKNEYAKHNLEVVKKMLEEQQNQDQNDQQDKNDDQKENKDDQKDEPFDKAQDRQKNKDNNQGGDQQKDKEDSSKGDDGQEDENDQGKPQENDESGESGQDKKEKKDQSNDSSQKAQDRQNDSRKDGKEKNKDAKGDKGEQQSDEKNNQEKPDKQQPQPDDRQKNIDAEGQPNEKKENKSAQQAGMPNEQALHLAPEDQWILQVLDQRENDEKKTNKALMRATVDKKLAGQNGKNCW